MEMTLVDTLIAKYEPILTTFQELDFLHPEHSVLGLLVEISDENALDEAAEDQLEILIDQSIQLLEVKDADNRIMTMIQNDYPLLKQYNDENISIIESTIQPDRDATDAVKGMFDNANGNAEVVYAALVNEKKFDSDSNQSHLNMLIQCLEDQWYAYYLDESPFYIGYAGGHIKNKPVVDKLMMVGAKTKALVVIDAQSATTAEGTLKLAKKFGYGGDDPAKGQLVVSTTDIQVRNGYLQNTPPRYIGSSLHMIGKILSKEEGEPFVGFYGAQGEFSGVKSVKFHSDTRDGGEFMQNGLVKVFYRKGAATFVGNNTAHLGDLESLKEIHNVIMTNRFEKDCVAFGNLMIGAKFGKEELAVFKSKLENYFNGYVKSGAIAGYTDVNVGSTVLANGQKVITVDVGINYKESVGFIEYSIQGVKGKLDMTRK